jgi:hypothetical protein
VLGDLISLKKAPTVMEPEGSLMLATRDVIWRTCVVLNVGIEDDKHENKQNTM